MTIKPKLLILGYGRHGKDTVGEMLRDDYGFNFTSSSLFVAQEVMWDNWGVAKYPDFDSMFEDRSNHRVLWMEMISAYNTPDKTKTAATMLERGFDMYVGMRRLDELEACRKAGIFDFIIWVDASKRLPPETGSMDITMANCGADFVIDNNGPEEELPAKVHAVMERIDKAQQSKEFMEQVMNGPKLFTNIFAEEPPDHPWDHMTPQEVFFDWSGVDPDEVEKAAIGDRIIFRHPIRAAPSVDTMTEALAGLNCILWHDPIDDVMVIQKLSAQAGE